LLDLLIEDNFEVSYSLMDNLLIENSDYLDHFIYFLCQVLKSYSKISLDY